jgi:hypothetical protein
MMTAAAAGSPHDIGLVHSARKAAAAHLLLLDVCASVESDDE